MNAIPNGLSLAAEKVFQTAGTATRETLKADPNGQRIPELVEQAHKLTDSLAQEAVELSPATQRPACCEGCSACCHLHVVATPLEVLAIAAVLKERLPPETLASVRSRIDHQIAATDGLDAESRRKNRTACPLLESGKCLAYEYRPISCRGWNSLDRAICDADLADPAANKETPVNINQYVLAGRVAEGLSAACHSMGLESQPLDFVRGLQLALDDPQSTSRAWRAGEKVLSSAVVEHVFPGPRNLEEEQARLTLWNSLK